jgi:hypothetical protein
VDRRIPRQSLRGHDLLTLEVQLGDLLAKSLIALAPANVADLLALRERPDVAGSLKHRMRNLPTRYGVELGDLPAPELEAFLARLEELPGAELPQTLRELLAAEAAKPGRAAHAARLLALAEHPEAAELFPVSAPRTVKRVAPAVKPVEDRRIPAHMRPDPPEDAPRAARAPREERAPRAAPVVAVDPERVRWIEATLLERIHATLGGNGLAEAVLVAGTLHRARDRYPDMTRLEVTSALKKLASDGRARTSAGRWMGRA